MAPDETPVRLPLENPIVKVAGAPVVIPRPENVANPFASVLAVADPINEPPDPVSVASTSTPAWPTALLNWSRSCTLGGDVNGTPETALPGRGVVIVNCVAAPAVSAIALDVAPVRPPDENESW